MIRPVTVKGLVHQWVLGLHALDPWRKWWL